MVFNLASAALIVEEYNTTGLITYTNYCLSITELVLVCINILSVWSFIKKKKNVSLFCLLIPVLLNLINNIVYSALTIHYYNKNLVYNEQFIWYSISILVTNALGLLGCFRLVDLNDDD